MPATTFNGSQRVVQELIKRPLSLFTMDVTTDPGEQSTYYYLRKEGNKSLYTAVFMGFRKPLVWYLSENKVISDKILNKEYRQRALQRFVSEYNTSLN